MTRRELITRLSWLAYVAGVVLLVWLARELMP